MDDKHKYHFEEERTAGAIRGNMSTYKKMKQWFDELQPHFQAEGFNVFNCNSESKLEAFPFLSYKDAIRKVTGEIGNTGQERVSGLYTKYEDKVRAYNTSRRNAPPLPSGVPAPGTVISPSRKAFPTEEQNPLAQPQPVQPPNATPAPQQTVVGAAEVSMGGSPVILDPTKIPEGDTSVIKG